MHCHMLSLTPVSYMMCVLDEGWGRCIAMYIVVSNSCQLHCVCVGRGLDEGMGHCRIHCCL